MAVPLIIGAAAAALPGLIGKGKNDRNARNITHDPNYNPEAHKFGQFGADAYSTGKRQQAIGIDNRQAPTTDYQHADYARSQGQQARAAQAQAANLMMQRAQGRVPSIANQQAALDMQRATAAQASAAASARGPAALALAQQGAANNTANAHGAISGQAQINAAQERLAAEQAAFQAQGGIRQQDLGAQTQEAQQAQYGSSLQLASRSANDTRAMGYEQMGHQGLLAEQQGRVQQQGILAQSIAASEGQNQTTANQNANNKGMIETIGDWFSDRRAKYVLSDFTAKEPYDQNFGAQAAPEPEKPKEDEGGMGSLMGMMSMGKGGGGLAGGGGGMLSDARAKREAYELGRAHSLEQIKADPRHAAELEGWKQTERKNLYKQQDLDAESARRGGTASRAPSLDDTAEAASDAVSISQSPGLRARVQAAKELGMQRRGEDIARGENLDGGDAEYRAKFGLDQPRESAPAPRPAPSMWENAQAYLGDIVSDFDAKEAFSPDAPRMQFDPSRGWHNPQQYDARSRLMSAMDEQAERDRVEAEQDAQVRALPARRANDPAVGLERMQEMRRQRELTGEGPKAPTLAMDEPTAADGKPMAPGSADFAATQPKKEKRPWWAGKDDEDFGAGGQLMAGLKMGGAFSGAQFPSDFTSKEAIDLDDPYETKLAPGEEAAFQAWKKKNAHPLDEGQDYDLRGAYKAGLQPGSDGHWSDRFKKPNHETFSNESQYADAPGARPGHWEGDRYVPPRTYDLDEPGPTAMRDGSSDPRTHSFDKTFKRDTPQDQARVKRAFEDRAGSEADRMIADFKRRGGEESGVTKQAVATRIQPSESPIAEANRTMEGSPYVYKPQYTPPDQKPGEPNFGFMAQNLERSPITATAVKEDEAGMKRVDAMKLLRILGASVADLQKQEDETRLALAKGGRRK